MARYQATLTPPLGRADREGDTYSDGVFDEAIFNSSLNNVYPLLLEHGETERGNAPIGIAKVLKNEYGYYADIEFNETLEKAIEYKSLVEQGAYSVSVGFLPKDFKENKTGGFHFNKTDFVELSLVSIPAVKEAKLIATKAMNKDAIVKKILTVEAPKIGVDTTEEADENPSISDDIPILLTKNNVNMEEQLNEPIGQVPTTEDAAVVKKSITPVSKKAAKKAVEVEIEDEEDDEEDTEEEEKKAAKKAKSIKMAQQSISGGYGGYSSHNKAVELINKSLTMAKDSIQSNTPCTLRIADCEDMSPVIHKRLAPVGLIQKAGTHTDGTTAYTAVKSDGSAPFFALNYINTPYAIQPQAVNLMAYLPFRAMAVNQIHLRSNGVKTWNNIKGAQVEKATAFVTNAVSQPLIMGRVAAFAQYYVGITDGQAEFVDSLNELVYVKWIDTINDVIVNGAAASANQGIAINGLKDLATAVATGTGTTYFGKITSANVIDLMNVAIGQVAEARFTPNLVLINPSQVTSMSVLKTSQGVPIPGVNDYRGFQFSNANNNGMAIDYFAYRGGVVLPTPAVAADEMYVLDTTKLTCGYSQAMTFIQMALVGDDILQGQSTLIAQTALQQGLASAWSGAVARVASISAAITNINKTGT